MSSFYYWLDGVSGLIAGFTIMTRGRLFTYERKFNIICLCLGCLVASFVYAYKFNERFYTYIILFVLWFFAYSLGKYVWQLID